MLETYWEAVFLGIIQGLTEFLPVSSSGHLAIAQALMDLKPESPTMLLFDVATHVATLTAVVVVFFGSFRSFVGRLIRDLRSPATEGSPQDARPWLVRAVAIRVTLLGVTASIPTAVIGLVFKDQLEAAFGKPPYIAAALVITGTLLLITAKLANTTKKGWRRFSFLAAFGVGVAQGLAIMPGISRSGATICTAMLLGLRRRWAAEFSFFIAVPAILGATLLHVRDVMDLSPDELAGLPVGPMAAGCAAAFLTGLLALMLLLAAVRRAKLAPFAWYCYAVAVAIVVLTITGRM